MKTTGKNRKQIAEELLSEGTEPADFLPIAGPEEEVAAGPQLTAIASPLKLLDVGFPTELAPKPRPLGTLPDPSAVLPRADVVVITWTAAEADALAGVFTPGFGRNNWYRYARRFQEDYRSQIRDGAPAAKVNRLGNYFPVPLGTRSILVMKSELHLNQDGKKTGDGTATLPVKRFFRQIIDEVKPKLVLTIGTAGGVFLEHDLGDVTVTRAAKFRLSDEFKNEPFN